MQLVEQRFSRRALGGIAAAAAAMVLLANQLRSGSALKTIEVFVLIALPPLAYLAFASPLIFPYGLYVFLMPFDGLLTIGKLGTLSKFLGLASGAALLLWSARRGTLLHVRPPLIFVAALVIWIFCSVWWSVDPVLTLKTIPTYAGLMFLFAVMSLVPVTLRQYRMLAAVTVASAVASALYGAYMFYADPLLAAQDDAGARLFSDNAASAIDPNLFADAMLFPFAIVTVYALTARRRPLKIAALCIVAILAISVALSASREAAIGLGVIVLYCAIRTNRLAQAAAIALAGLAAGWLVPNPLWSRFSTLASPRQAIWGVGLEAFKHRWVTGYGLGSFIPVYDQFYLKVHQIYPNGWESPAHNVAVHFMVELGVVGLALIVLIFLSQLRELRAIERGSELYNYRVMCEAGLVAIACMGMFIDLFNAKWAWFALAMCAQLSNLPQEVMPSQSEPHSPP